MRCPCGLGATYEVCCGRLHDGAVAAPTAERVMRARYSAFALGHESYLLRSWHPSTRPVALELDPAQEWVGLEVVSVTDGGLLDTEGIVEFLARNRDHGDGQVGVLHEHSRFVRHERRWVYRSSAPG